MDQHSAAQYEPPAIEDLPVDGPVTVCAMVISQPTA